MKPTAVAACILLVVVLQIFVDASVVTKEKGSRVDDQSACLTATNCADCIEMPECGFCASSGKCVTGTSSGPSRGWCSNWQFNNCYAPYVGPTSWQPPAPQSWGPTSWQPEAPSSWQPQPWQPQSWQPQSWQPPAPQSWGPTSWQPQSWQPQSWQPQSWQPESPTSWQPQSWQPQSWQPQSPSSWQPQQAPQSWGPTSWQPQSWQPQSWQPQAPQSWGPTSWQPQAPQSWGPTSWQPQSSPPWSPGAPPRWIFDDTRTSEYIALDGTLTTAIAKIDWTMSATQVQPSFVPNQNYTISFQIVNFNGSGLSFGVENYNETLYGISSIPGGYNNGGSGFNCDGTVNRMTKVISPIPTCKIGDIVTIQSSSSYGEYDFFLNNMWIGMTYNYAAQLATVSMRYPSVARISERPMNNKWLYKENHWLSKKN